MKICRKQLQGIAYLYSYCIQIHSERTGFHTVKNRQMFLWSCIFVRFIFSYELFYGGSLSKYLIRTQIKTIWKNARKNLFAVRLVERWNKLLREGCEVSFFWRYLKPNWTQSWASCSGWLCEQEAELEGLFRPPPFCGENPCEGFWDPSSLPRMISDLEGVENCLNFQLA